MSLVESSLLLKIRRHWTPRSKPWFRYIILGSCLKQSSFVLIFDMVNFFLHPWFFPSRVFMKICMFLLLIFLLPILVSCKLMSSKFQVHKMVDLSPFPDGGLWYLEVTEIFKMFYLLMFQDLLLGWENKVSKKFMRSIEYVSQEAVKTANLCEEKV